MAIDFARLRRAAPTVHVLALAGGFLLLVLVAASSAFFAARQRAAHEAVLQTINVQIHLARTLMLTQDAETGQRGYLLTNDPAYLAPYYSAAAALPQELNEVDAATQYNPRQHANRKRLRALAVKKLDELKATLDLQSAGKAREARALVDTDFGKRTMDGVRETITAMQEEAGRMLDMRLRHARDLADTLQLIIFCAVALIIVLAAVALDAMRKTTEALVRSRDTAQQAHIRLSAEMSNREAAEEQVRQMQKMESLGQLTGGIAHDFNNMLAVIISALSLMQKRLERGDTDVGKFVDAAQDAARRAATLTSRLLAFSRKQALAPAVIDINRLVSDMSELLRRTLGEAVKMETVLAGGLWRTYVDPGQLENAIVNLCVNARDAMDGGGNLTIETANAHLDDAYAARHAGVPAGQYVMVAVSDDGPGMSAEVMERAFDPFFTTKPVGKGTGLGLSQVYGYVKQSNGHVKIYSEAGQGTTVKLYLPRAHRTDREHVRAAEMIIEPGDAREIVLVVEDDERVRALTVASLRELGYTVLHAESAATALRLLEANPGVVLLFTDVVMPDMNGRRLAEEATKTRPDLKVLYTTGYTSNAVVHNGVIDPGAQLLMKPFTLEQLSMKVREMLGPRPK